MDGTISRLRVSAVACLASLLIACQAAGPAAPSASGASSASATPKEGGTLTVAIPPIMVNVDDSKNGDYTLSAVLAMVNEKLITRDSSGKIVPQLAESWTASADSKTWTFKLRKGVVFQDGAPFNADAVKKSFDRLRSTTFNLDRGKQYSTIESVDVVDDSTVQFKLKDVWAQFLIYLTYAPAEIITPNYANTKDLPLAIGTGPFKMESWQPQQQTVLARNDKYWGQKPHLDKIILKEIADQQARVSALQTGAVDVDFAVAPQFVQQFANNKEFVVQSGPSDVGLSIDFNLTHKPFDDVRVRQAFLAAIDRNSIIKSILLGQASPLNAFPSCAPGVNGCYDIPNYQGFDTAKAKSLLAEAGYPNGLKATLVYGADKYTLLKEILTAIQAQLKEAGIDLTLVSQEWTSYLGSIFVKPEANKYDMTAWAWTSVINDVGFGLDSRIPTKKWAPNGSNVMYYSSPTGDDLLAKASRETDEAKRNDLLKQAQVLVMKDMPLISILTYNNTLAQSSRVHNVKLTVNSFDPTYAFKN